MYAPSSPYFAGDGSGKYATDFAMCNKLVENGTGKREGRAR
jgi:hypothetical protein